MKHHKKIGVIVFIVALIFGSLGPVANAAGLDSTSKADTLKTLGLITGKSNGYALGDMLTREEGVSMILSAFGLLDDAKTLTDQEVEELLAKVADRDQISGWAKKNVAYAIKDQLSIGVNISSPDQASVFHWEPKGKVDAKTFANWILYKMGYHINLTAPVAQLKDDTGASIPYSYTFNMNKAMNRDMAINMMYDILTAKFADQSGTVISALIESGTIDKKLAQRFELYPPDTAIDTPAVSDVPSDNTVWLASSGQLVDWNDSDGTIYKDLSYGDNATNKYDLYIPANATRKEDVGVVLFVHGGSWNSGDKSDLAYMSKKVTKAGYISASINYSLADGKSEDFSISKVMDEIQASVGAIKAELRNKGFNATKLAIGGYSAGGHLSSLYAYSRADVSPIPVVLEINQVGPSDFHLDTWWGSSVTDEVLPDGAEFINGLAGSTITAEQIKNGEAEEVINSISPVHFVNRTSVPTVLGYGARDTFVQSGHPEKLVAALEKAGVDHTFILYPNSGHELGGDKSKTDEFTNAMFAYIEKYFGYSPYPNTAPKPSTAPNTNPTAPDNAPKPGVTAGAEHFSKDLLLKSGSDSMFPGATMELGADGSFALKLPGFPDTISTYKINGSKLEVTNDGGYKFSYIEKSGEYKVTVSAAGGSVKLDFYTDFNAFK